MKKHSLLQSVAFLLLAVLMLTGLGLVLREKDGSLSEIYSLGEDSVSALFAGGSHVSATYIPAALWSEYGIAAENLYSPNQPLWTTYHYLREALKTQEPDVIVLELFGLTYGYSYSAPEAIDSDNAEAGFHMKLSPNFYGMVAASSIFGVESPAFPEYLNLVRYHYRWKELDGSFFSGMSAEHTIERGYELLTRTESFSDADFSESAEPFEPYIGSRVYLELIVRLAESRGIPLLLSVSPYACNDAERGIFAWAREYADDNGLLMLNYNGADGKRVGVDRSRDLADVGHTNYGGALKVTRDMGAYLSENYELRARGEAPDAEQRDADAADFAEKARISADITTADPAAFFSLAAAEPSYTVFCAGSLSSEQLAELAALGVEGIAPGEPFAAISTLGVCEQLETGRGARLEQAYAKYTVTASGDEAKITVNGKEYAAQSGGAVFLLFKNDYGWPLDLEWYAPDGSLAHAEFTSGDLEALAGARD